MGKILSIDTATEICSVALGIDGALYDKMEAAEDRSHAKLLTVLIQDLLQKNQMDVSELDAIAVSEGPGSYTGLRIGVSVAKGICYAGKFPLIGVSTLQTIVSGYLQSNTAEPDTVLLPMLDARRMEVYYAEYDSALNEIIPATPLVIESGAFEEYKNKTEVVFMGSGAEKCSEVVGLSNAKFVSELPNKAEFMVTLAEAKLKKKQLADVAYFEPAYLKPFIATQSKKKFF